MDKSIEIYIKPNPTPTGPNDRYIFSMDEGNGATQELIFDKTKDGMKKSENYRIKFKLKNQDGAALRFSKDKSKVLWAKPVSKKTDPCPDRDCYMNGVFFVDPNDTIKDHELTVINTDPVPQLFKFAFNFLPPGKSDPLPDSEYEYYDPIGDNLDGGFEASDSFAASPGTLAVAGAMAGALVGFLTVDSANSLTGLLWGAIIGGAIGFLVGLFMGRRREGPLG
jgi:hypothetical protein